VKTAQGGGLSFYFLSLKLYDRKENVKFFYQNLPDFDVAANAKADSAISA